MKNKHAIETSNIKEFIQYKLNNKKQSETEARVLILKTKYQHVLDGIFKQIDKKNAELEHYKLQTKRMKKGIWDSLITVSNAVQTIQRDTYEHANRIRQMNQHKLKIQKQLQSQKKMEEFQQKQLQDKIRVIHEQTQHYFKQKNSAIQQLKSNATKLQELLAQKDPIVSQYYDKILLEEDKITELQKIKQQKQQKMKINIQYERQLHNLKQKKIEAQTLKQQNQIRQTEDRRNLIMEQISSLNKAFIQNKHITQSIEKIKNRVNELNGNGLEDEEKLKQVKQRLLDFKPTKTVSDIYVKESLIEQSSNQIEYLKSKMNQLDTLEQQLMAKEKKVIGIEQEKSNQVRRLQETILKMEESLAKT